MQRFARIVVGYHGCTERFAGDLLLGSLRVSEWRPSTNSWDWLGHGIYFWEHSPTRAMRWARERYEASPAEKPSVIGAVINLGRCFDLLDEAFTKILAETHATLKTAYDVMNVPLPANRGPDLKRRDLDCLVINRALYQLHKRGLEYDTVRCAFVEGGAAFAGSGFANESHVQVAVRNSESILGVFRPN